MLVICGTNRPSAATRRVSKRVQTVLAETLAAHPEFHKRLGATVGLLDLADLKQDIFDPKVYENKPEWFIAKYQTPITNSRGIIVVLPEYNGSFPGVLKYFIDMLEFPKSLKEVPAAFVGISAGLFGALRAVEQLEMIFAYRKAHLYGERLFIADIENALATDGSIGDHEARLQTLCLGFLQFAAKLAS